ncbi:MAG TPA: 5-oxoprolinase subunit PxpB [Chitinophagaceae bacterium]|nr:5-oxoprolinase subunit PxpB [Chitinophagaceae bacterium]
MSEGAAVIDLGSSISPTLNNKILSMQQWLRLHPFRGLKDVVVAYSSLTVLFDPFIIYNGRNTVFESVSEQLEVCFHSSGNEPVAAPRQLSVPVCYELGYDLEELAEAKGLTVEEIVRIHCSVSYRVYMLGFLPGFAYMGIVDNRIAAPRRAVPRTNVEAGSVGIAGSQTGIYPLNSPGGWQIIGRTPLRLFDANASEPALFSPGDEVRFYSISLNQFQSWH